MKPALETAVRELAELKLEYKIELADPPCQDCGWTQDEHSIMEAPDNPNRCTFNPGPPTDVPFFSEAYLYDLVGKDGARSIRVRLYRVLRAAGVSDDLIYELF